MNLISLQHVTEIGSLPEAVRKEVDLWQDAFRAVTRPAIAGVRRIAERFGVSFSTAWRKYHAWKREGWRALVNRAKSPDRDRVSEEFVQWYLALAERNQRKTRPAHRVFGRMWRAGETIPGVDNSLPRHELPPGCTYANLQRYVKSQFALAAMRRGLGVALAKHGPKVWTTRAQLWPGSHWMIDDVWHDHFVVFQGQLVRVLELGALDVFSAHRFAYGTKPRFTREDGKFDNLKEASARLLLASGLFQQGFSPRGTIILAEHGTAAIAERIQRLLRDRFGLIAGTNTPLISVQESGINGKQQAIAGLRGQGGGNPRHKSALESLHNLIHNELAALPAQTGRDVEHRPEFTHGQLTEGSDVLKIAAWLNRVAPDRVAQLQAPLLEYHAHFLPLLDAIHAGISRRGEDPEIWDHELEGWHAAGNVRIEYRFSADAAQWIGDEQVRALPAPAQAAFTAMVKSDERLFRQRQLSPREAWARGAGTLQKIPAFVVAEMLGEDCARELKCERSYFEFQDGELHPEILRYESRVTEPDGTERELPEDKYLAFVNPFDLAQLFIHDAAGRHIGIARRATRVSRTDVDAVQAQFKRNATRLHDLLKPIKARHTQTVREASARLKNNADVIAGVAADHDELAALAEASLMAGYNNQPETPQDEQPD